MPEERAGTSMGRPAARRDLRLFEQEGDETSDLAHRELAAVRGRHDARLVASRDARVGIENRLPNEGAAPLLQRRVQVRPDRRLRARGGEGMAGAATGREEDT